jgi:hypothetical protein
MLRVDGTASENLSTGQDLIYILAKPWLMGEGRETRIEIMEMVVPHHVLWRAGRVAESRGFTSMTYITIRTLYVQDHRSGCPPTLALF